MSHPAPDPNASSSSAPLISTLADDPEMVELVRFFVEEIDERVNTILTTSRGNDIIGLRTIAHQLKGAGTGYGFEPISKMAGELERLIDESEALEVTDAIQQQVDNLIDLCRRASA